MATALAENRTPKSERQLEREANILAVAREALTEKGYDGVTMNALAEQAGVVKKTLYNLYGSKDALLLAAISEVINSYRGGADPTGRGIAAIVAGRVAASRRIVETPEYAEAMTKALVQADPAHPLIQVLLRDAVADHAAHLEAARACGELQDGVDVAELAEQVAAQGWGLILLWMKGLVPLEQFDTRSLRGLLALLIPVTRGACRRRLAEMLEQTTFAHRGGNER